MEFFYASLGMCDELRVWLAAHPERVNIPARASGQTLLGTALASSHGVRASLNALSAGYDTRHSSHERTVRMLVEEFNADIGSPNGGDGGTAIHIAVEMGSDELLGYLLLHNAQAAQSPNVFGELPLDQAVRRHGKDSVCAKMLRDVTHTPRIQPVLQPRSTTPAVLAWSEGGDIREKLQRLRVVDSDDDGGNEKDLEAQRRKIREQEDALFPLHPPSPTEGQLPVSLPALGGEQPSNPCSPDVSTSTCLRSSSDNACPHVPLSANGLRPSSTQPWVMRDVSRCLAEVNCDDLVQFRATFGDGFTFLQCRDHYEVRALLPYRVKQLEYYTPVILLVYPPQDQIAHVLPPGAGYTRYRSLIDYENINNFAINRRALYIDPLTGAIIPSLADETLYDSLVVFVQKVIIHNFEQCAPLVDRSSPYAFIPDVPIAVVGTPDDTYHHHRSTKAPLFMSDVLQSRDALRLRVYRVLQDLSRFGDGLFSFEPAKALASGVIPLYRHTNQRGADVRPWGQAPGSPQATQPPSPRLGSYKLCEHILNIRVRIHFLMVSEGLNAQPQIAYREPPVFEILDCGPSAERAADVEHPTWNLLSSLRTLVDGRGRVLPIALEPAYSQWATSEGSLVALLAILQKQLTRCVNQTISQYHATSPTRAHQNCSDEGVAALDELFAESRSGSTPLSAISTSGGIATPLKRVPLCAICGAHRIRFVLVPCRHACMCTACEQRLRAHHRGPSPGFNCPICHVAVTEVWEILQ